MAHKYPLSKLRGISPLRVLSETVTGSSDGSGGIYEDYKPCNLLREREREREREMWGEIAMFGSLIFWGGIQLYNVFNKILHHPSFAFRRNCHGL